MNINNGKTGIIDIPAPLHSTGGDGDGQVGNVVAYAGDIYDDNIGKNQSEINKKINTIPLEGVEGQNGSLMTPSSEGMNIITSTESVIIGQNCLADKPRSINFPIGFQSIYLTGSNKVYTAEFSSAPNKYYNPMKGAFATACIGTSIITSGVHTFAAKIVSATCVNDVLTLTLDTDLGTLNYVKYCFQNYAGQANLNFGGFMNGGRQGVALGTAVATGKDAGMSTNIGAFNGVETGYNTAIGLYNKVKDRYSLALGVYNQVNTESSTAIGRNNQVNTESSTAIGRNNTINGSGQHQHSVFGYDNTVANTADWSTVIGAQNEILYNGVVIGCNSKNYVSNDDSVKNFFVIGAGANKDDRANSIEQKYNGDLYIQNVGGFNGKNSSDPNVKTLQKVLAEKGSGGTITVTGALEGGNSFITKTTDANGNVTLDTSLIDTQLQSIVGNYTDGNPTGLTLYGSTGGKIDYEKSLEINPSNYVSKTDGGSISTGTNVTVTGKDSIGAGAGAYITADRVFGFGTALNTIYLTGSNKTYSAQIGSSTTWTVHNAIAKAFCTTNVNSYILDSTTFENAAKIVSATYNGASKEITITLDTDLGTLSKTKYNLPNVFAGQRSFCFGSGSNTGQYSNVVGTYDFNISNYSNLIGYRNVNLGGTYNSIYGGNNTIQGGQGQSIVGYGNEQNSTANYNTVVGALNIIDSSHPQALVGFDNKVQGNTQVYLLGFSNTFNSTNPDRTAVVYAMGTGLNSYNSGVVLGQYNKDYETSLTKDANWFAIGKGSENNRLNIIEQKYNGDLYIDGIGGFDGTNSTEENVKPLQQVINSFSGGSGNGVKYEFDEETNTLNITGDSTQMEFDEINLTLNITV